ncbi:hypothetical protein K491DRAFT_511731 [Lophiostoma macrostomum CBS 122681]|uniref:Uncharacterized protein n=1 Tax=Lophiostoma macrostomum CBS 122681 TaxID=1314788 RepID=A0A6A6T0Q1_9PLEO|nr:hypothetical protein K491DRAFT_511731 [Lophiostoma macrostomum CBS 122681]
MTTWHERIMAEACKPRHNPTGFQLMLPRTFNPGLHDLECGSCREHLARCSTGAEARLTQHLRFQTASPTRRRRGHNQSTLFLQAPVVVAGLEINARQDSVHDKCASSAGG